MEEFFNSNPFTAALWWVFNQMVSDPNILTKLITLAVVFLVLRVIILIIALIQTARRKKWREQYARGYSSEQRAAGFLRANGRCEFDSGMGRCSNRAEHADHFYPWSRGGATSMQNLVAACAPHNLSKSAKMPSMMLKTRIENRRRGYFPKSVSVVAGEWSVRHKAPETFATVPPAAPVDWAADSFD